ncbi:hypothetical protein PNOK_0929000 [Pyrrhoderma noxium]|uniref:Uncharacterized protein n=1 Tax=Pyrrhoderma noxium TaxID=2282107 RepID=A0A286U7H4_9AGAM|nr:hypothetical protein PNOK_0929000 [Pyrrhoderma noxium]
MVTLIQAKKRTFPWNKEKWSTIIKCTNDDAQIDTTTRSSAEHLRFYRPYKESGGGDLSLYWSTMRQ